MNKKQSSLLLMMRHGESVWNKQNLFTSWVDVPLSQRGVEEAVEAGKALSRIPIDVVFTSELIRAKLTSMIVMAHHASDKTPCIVETSAADSSTGNIFSAWKRSSINNALNSSSVIPVHCAWQLNERYYGELQGLNKDESRQKWGAEQVKIWRRSYATPPPGGESIEMTARRTLPYFTSQILPHLTDAVRHTNVLVVAHGTTLRCLSLYFDGVLDGEGKGTPESDFIETEFDNGAPVCYSYDHESRKFTELDFVDAVKVYEK